MLTMPRHGRAVVARQFRKSLSRYSFRSRKGSFDPYSSVQPWTMDVKYQASARNLSMLLYWPSVGTGDRNPVTSTRGSTATKSMEHFRTLEYRIEVRTTRVVPQVMVANPKRYPNLWRLESLNVFLQSRNRGLENSASGSGSRMECSERHTKCV